MANEDSLQDIIRRRQQAGFVGREDQLARFRANMTLPPKDNRRKFVFNIHGDGGVGKTYLVQQLRHSAEQEGALCAYIDESAFGVFDVMNAIAADLAQQDARLRRFEKLRSTYLERRHELESDPHFPERTATSVTRTVVGTAFQLSSGVPIIGALTNNVDASATAAQVERFRVFLAKKLRSHTDVRLILSPTEVLTPVFVEDLVKVGKRAPLALFFDTYERTGPLLDDWLLSLLQNRYGSLPANIVITIAGRSALDPTRWEPYRIVLTDIPLMPFTEIEARQFLFRKNVTDERLIEFIFHLSGCLPLLVAMLAENHPDDPSTVGDPSGDAVEKFLNWENDDKKRDLVLAAALPRRLDEEVLQALTSRGDHVTLFRWLRNLPFVNDHGGRCQYHEIVRAPILQLARGQSPQAWKETHQRLADAFRQWRDEHSASGDDNWTDTMWQEYTTEETYHRLCAEPCAALSEALCNAVRARVENTAMARRWAQMIEQAGEDSSDGIVLQWGRKLSQCVRDNDEVAFLTDLLQGEFLDVTSRCIALIERGRCHLRADCHDNALDDFDCAIGLDRHNVAAIAGRGDSYRRLNRYDEALANYNHAIELNRADPAAIAGRGATYRDMSDYEQAIVDYNRAIELNPDDAAVIADRGWTYRRMHRYDEALADYNHAITLNADDPAAIAGRGATYRDMSLYKKAIADYNRAIELNPDDAFAIAGRGRTYRLMSHYDEALADYSRAIELNPDDAFAIAGRGDTYRDMSRYDDALTDYNRAIELNPSDTAVSAARDQICRLTGR